MESKESVEDCSNDEIAVLGARAVPEQATEYFGTK